MKKLLLVILFLILPIVVPAVTYTPRPIGKPLPLVSDMPVGNLPGWTQTYTQDFNTDVPIGGFPGSTYSNSLSVYPDGTPDTAGQQGAPSRYYPSKVADVSRGTLELHLHTENGTPMAAAILPDAPNTLYGKYTIRFALDSSLKGFKTAWLLWPNSETWPRDGEIDFPEGDLNSTIGGFVHHQGATSGSDQDAFSTNQTYIGWHTASTEWTPGKVTFILDGKVIGTTTNRVPNTPMHWVVQTESCLDGCPAPSAQSILRIGWIVAYKQA